MYFTFLKELTFKFSIDSLFCLFANYIYFYQKIKIILQLEGSTVVVNNMPFITDASGKVETIFTFPASIVVSHVGLYLQIRLGIIFPIPLTLF